MHNICLSCAICRMTVLTNLIYPLLILLPFYIPFFSIFSISFCFTYIFLTLHHCTFTKENNRQHRIHLFNPIPCPEYARGSCEKKKLPLTREKFWQNQTQEGWPSALTSWCFREQEWGDNKHHNTRPRIPAEKEKHKLMTTIMLFVHREKKWTEWGKVYHGRSPCLGL